MADIKDRAREYIAKHSEYSEMFGGTFIAVDTFTAMVEFAEQETKELREQIERMKSDVMANIKWADKNCDNMWQKLVKMWNQWEIEEK